MWSARNICVRHAVCPVMNFVAAAGPIVSQQKSQVGPTRASVFEIALQRTGRSHSLSKNLCKKHFSHKRVCPVINFVAVPAPIVRQHTSQVGPKRARVFETCLQRTRRRTSKFGYVEFPARAGFAHT